MTRLRTFGLPGCVDGTDSDVALANQLVEAWKTDMRFQISCDRWQTRRVDDTFEAGRRFFAQPADLKSRCVSDLTYAGYTATEDLETYTVCQDISLHDVRVQAQWPGHGPVPWPSMEHRRTMRNYMDEMRRIGDKLAHLIGIGLGITDFEALTSLTDDGWHHLVVQQFRSARPEVGKYGLLAITADEESGTLTVTPGEMMRFLTNGTLRPGPPAVRQKCQVMTYFHEPSFDVALRPLLGPDHGCVHYGTHFTDVYLRRFPDRITSRRILAEGRLAVLADMSRRASVGA
ncbi:MAG: 2-oxoglutarate and iron-dependent oxygenase domain-containing protein [Kibdelosporangium sp.]